MGVKACGCLLQCFMLPMTHSDKREINMAPCEEEKEDLDTLSFVNKYGH